ncbi:MAG: PKD domain-containing protein [Anaerolineales bacterium]|nr:PKD domain-containing protein [Anaerolineales bacterium]
MTNREPEPKQKGRRRWRVFRFDMLLLIFLLSGWSLIFTTATLGLQDNQEQWLPVGLFSQISGDYTVKAANAPRLARINPEIIEAVKRDQILLATPTPTTLAATATLTNQQTITGTALGTWQVSIGGPYKGQEGSEIPVSAELTGSMLNLLPGVVSYVWDLDDDGRYDDANSASTSVAFYDEGEYLIGVQATDLLGQVNTAVTTVSVSNVAPLVTLGQVDAPSEEGQEVAFAAVASDPGHDVLLYTWDFGDNSPPVTDSLTPRHTYPDNGDYTVRLIVWDNDGGETEATAVVRVDNLPPEVDAGPDQKVDEGDKVTFTGTATDAGVLDTLAYAWDFNYDGLNFTTDATGPTVSNVYPNGPNNIVVALKVRDKDGGEALDTVRVEVSNASPVITGVSDDGPVGEGSPLALTVAATDVGKEDKLTYAFDWDNDGSFDETGATNKASNIWYNQGDYTVRIRVDDGDGGRAFATKIVAAFNEPPVAVASAGGTALEGDAVAFDGSDSTDPGRDDALTYRWDFGDGSSGSGVSPAHTYNDNGVYSATLTVSDDSGGSATAGVGVTVLNANPVADAGSDLTVDEGTNVSLAYSGKATDPGAGDTLSYAWDFDYDSGAFNEEAAGAAGTKIFPALDGPDEYVIALRVRDDDYPFPTGGGGEVGEALDTIKLTVKNLPPWNVSAGGPYSGKEMQRITLNATAEDVAGDLPLEYAWDLDDNPLDFEFGQQITHIWERAGAYTIRLRVKDTDGGESFASALVEIGNADPTVTLAFSPVTPTVILPVTFVATGSDPTNDPLTYRWNFGDGSPAVVTTTATLTHTYPDDRVYTATVTADDRRGGTDTATAFVAVRNLPPVAVASASPTSVVKDNPVAFDAGGSSDPDDPPGTLTYHWDFGDGSSNTGVNVSHLYSQEGTYTATLTVTDDNGVTNTASVVVTVTNSLPTAAITSVAPNPGAEGSPITFDSSGSSDPDSGDVLTYQWDFGDGSPPVITTNPTTSHTYVNGPVTYNVTLTVTDGDGGIGTATLPVDVSNVAPIANAGPDQTVNEGDPVTFDGSGSSDPGMNDTLSYEWDFDYDGANFTVDDTSGPNLTTSYPNGPSTVTVALRVTDNDGDVSTVDTLQVMVNNVPPIANASANPNPVDEGSPVIFDGSGSSDPGGDPLTYAWDFGDGNNASGVTASHVYPDGPANYDVIFTVTDSDGATGSVTIPVVVNNVAPTAAATADQTSVNAGDTVNFDGSGSTDPGNDSLSYTWDFDDGATSGGATTSHSWTSSGTYTIILTVSDGEGGVGTAQVQVTVN